MMESFRVARGYGTSEKSSELVAIEGVAARAYLHQRRKDRQERSWQGVGPLTRLENMDDGHTRALEELILEDPTEEYEKSFAFGPKRMPTGRDRYSAFSTGKFTRGEPFKKSGSDDTAAPLLTCELSKTVSVLEAAWSKLAARDVASFNRLRQSFVLAKETAEQPGHDDDTGEQHKGREGSERAQEEEAIAPSSSPLSPPPSVPRAFDVEGMQESLDDGEIVSTGTPDRTTRDVVQYPASSPREASSGSPSHRPPPLYKPSSPWVLESDSGTESNPVSNGPSKVVKTTTRRVTRSSSAALLKKPARNRVWVELPTRAVSRPDVVAREQMVPSTSSLQPAPKVTK